MRIVYIFVLFLASCLAAEPKTRKVRYARCEEVISYAAVVIADYIDLKNPGSLDEAMYVIYEGVTMPKAVFLTCHNDKGICQVKRGSTHTLTALFRSDINSTEVSSYAAWNNFFALPLPGQEREACKSSLNCPVQENALSRFTYQLEIQNFWPGGEFPVIWSLTDEESGDYVVCFLFKIMIV